MTIKKTLAAALVLSAFAFAAETANTAIKEVKANFFIIYPFPFVKRTLDLTV